MKRAAAYRKKHPSMSMVDAVKKIAADDRKKKRAPAKKAAARKKKVSGVAPRQRKVKLKIKPGKNGKTTVQIGKAPKLVKKVAKALGIKMGGIAGVGMSELRRNMEQLQRLRGMELQLKKQLKDKAHKLSWPTHRRDLAKTQNAIKATRKHITALKRTI